MAKVKVAPATGQTVEESATTSTPEPAAAQPAETFTWQFADGSRAVVGKPQGVLALRIRQILDQEELKDQELRFMVQAMLSIRKIVRPDGSLEPLACANRAQFNALLQRFSSDELLSEFMVNYQKLVNPGLTEAIEAAVNDAMSQGIVDDAGLKAFVGERLLALQRERQRDIKNS